VRPDRWRVLPGQDQDAAAFPGGPFHIHYRRAVILPSVPDGA
jgi:hypothetical protein